MISINSRTNPRSISILAALALAGALFQGATAARADDLGGGAGFDDAANAAAQIPDCLDASGSTLPVDNAAVLALKTSTPNQYLTRAHVSGTIERIYPDHSGHNHFEVQIGPQPTDTIEFVYNISFGQLPNLQPGMTAEACGDYITSDAPTSQYPASPDNAIMHWIHRNPKGHGHPSGFVVIDGSLFGQGSGHGD
jgi:hypothetical protein